jgi:hypothetical protein
MKIDMVFSFLSESELDPIGERFMRLEKGPRREPWRTRVGFHAPFRAQAAGIPQAEAKSHLHRLFSFSKEEQAKDPRKPRGLSNTCPRGQENCSLSKSARFNTTTQAFKNSAQELFALSREFIRKP